MSRNKNKSATLSSPTVLFDCLAPLAFNGNRFNLDVKCGVTTSIGYDQSSASVKADVMIEAPYLNSLGTGEILPLDNIESHSRKKVLELADACGRLADELLLHKQRLEDIATSDDDLLPADVIEDAIAHGPSALGKVGVTVSVDDPPRRVPYSSRGLDSADDSKPAVAVASTSTRRSNSRSTVNVDFLNAAMASMRKPEP